MDYAPNGAPGPPLDSGCADISTLGPWSVRSVRPSASRRLTYRSDRLPKGAVMISVVACNVTTSPVGGTVPTAADGTVPSTKGTWRENLCPSEGYKF